MSEKKDLLARVVIVLRNAVAQVHQELDDILKDLAAEALGPEEWIPDIDLADLDAAPWISYRSKGPAKSGENAWIKNPGHFSQFEAPPVILELVKALVKLEAEKPGMAGKVALRLGDMEYFFSGERKFVARRPVREEKASEPKKKGRQKKEVEQ